MTVSNYKDQQAMSSQRVLDSHSRGMKLFLYGMAAYSWISIVCLSGTSTLDVRGKKHSTFGFYYKVGLDQGEKNRQAKNLGMDINHTHHSLYQRGSLTNKMMS